MAEMTKEQAAMVLDPESSEEAMEEIKRLSGYTGEDMELKVIRDACRVAVKVLRTPGPLEKLGEPLTSEQLREMDGQPAYLEIARHPHLSGWYIVQRREKNVRLLNFSGWVTFVDSEMTAYAYPPAHIDREVLSCAGCDYLDRENVPCAHCLRAAGYADYYKPMDKPENG